ncbi:hippurate hydrolase [Pseudooceanicola antarcticus]|uniref:Amidohydrolase n=1 Tax=Pseudooceanicola antarcticus TaxID=1247613 RepID=A0A285ILS8_9RHOB|nr:amidohydrolase [Pseudooceanicola antarcticus]PJE28582.1 amidohydrolase [Pseudooceanicola antarcticus]SNY48894.1 hippurate hydrolase [Pseudooceanicola antarcticus]
MAANTDVARFLADRFPEYRDFRRDIHAHPELGFEETRTSALVAERLAKAGYEVTTGLGITGLVATLRRGKGPTIGIRADMDALPMDEHTNLPHASKTPGKMHACGHDGHTASLLATAEALAAHGNFSGTVHMIFQPAEEGQGGGAKMIEDGLFARFPCDRLFGFHNDPRLPLGRAALRAGPTMASADEFRITLTGRGGHAAMPHLAKDVALALSQLVVSLQSLVARRIDPLNAAVVSVTQIHVGSAFNVIAESGWISGTLRCLVPEDRSFLEAGIRRLARAQAEAAELEVEIDWHDGYPPLCNDPAAVEDAAQVLASDAAPVSFHEADPILAAEDFAFMLNEVPGAYVFFGMAEEGQVPVMVHDPAYDFNDRLIPIVAESMVALVEAELPG